MENLKIFAFDTNAIRTVTVNNEPWFVGKDIASALGYGDTDQAIRKHVDEEDKLNRQIDGTGQKRDMVIINESGMYALIFGSKLESAKKFKHWVTSEVLPSIRKTGSYSYDKMEVAKMISECKSATGVKGIIKLFDMECETNKTVSKNPNINDFVKNNVIAGRRTKDVYADYIKYTGDARTTLQNFSKQLSHCGYESHRIRECGALVSYYREIGC